MKKIINTFNIDDTIKLGTILGRALKENMVITLEGDLGAGKTTFTKGIGIGLNIDATINSPTFTIMKIYDGRLTLYHMDVYRLDNFSGDDDLEEYFYNGGVCVIEWASNIDSILPDNFLKITISDLGDGKRSFLFESDDKEYIDIIERVSL